MLKLEVQIDVEHLKDEQLLVNADNVHFKGRHFIYLNPLSRDFFFSLAL